MSITIKQVTTKKMLKDFIKFEGDLYKDNPYYVPCLFVDEMKQFDREKNVNYGFAETVEFLAYKDDKIVGRICGIINNRFNAQENVKHLRFNHLDFIDDKEVSKALFDAVCKWGKAKGMDTVTGPLGITDLDKQGMLVNKGFDKPGMFITNYNFEYYQEHMDALGFSKDCDWVEYYINVPEKLDDKMLRIKKINDYTMRKFGFHLVKPKNKKELVNVWSKQLFETYNAAFAPLHGVTKLEQDQIDMYTKDYFSVINLDYLSIVTNKDNHLIGVAILVPSMTKGMQKAKGKLFPFGWYHILKGMRHPVGLDMLFVAVDPKYQGYGVNGIMIIDILEKCLAKGIKFAETGPELEGNEKVQAMWKNFNADLIRNKRCWIRDI